jgi:hypothetical protein
VFGEGGSPGAAEEGKMKTDKILITFIPAENLKPVDMQFVYELTTEQKLALLEAMGIPTDEFYKDEPNETQEFAFPIEEHSVSLREFIEREGK